MVEAEGDEDPDRQEGEQLDQRLERNRRDQPLVPLGGVEVARAEDDREGGERQRDIKRGVERE
ncbi:MAG: hypothetical protein U0841_11000 [Chloroflexia bacterium]